MARRWRPDPSLPRQPDHSRLPTSGSPLVVLKEGELFFVQTAIAPDRPEGGEGGLYYQDTRFLLPLAWWMAGHQPLVLSSGVYESNRAQIDLTNPDMEVDGQLVPAHSVHLRVTLIVADRLYQRLRLVNFTPSLMRLPLAVSLGADFVDIFEVRGMRRKNRGQLLDPEVEPARLRFRYHGLDGLTRTTSVFAEPAPDRWEALAPGRAVAHFTLALEPRQKHYQYLAVDVGLDERPAPPPVALGRVFTAAALKQARMYRAWDTACTRIQTDNDIYNAALRQATADMRALVTEYPGQGRIVDAGIPWYVAPFGRDACITAIETLLLNPDIAVDSLTFLANLQGREDNAWRDEEPGKILHELRRGEMARCGEIPHTPYYGSVDSTLWWIIALFETWRFTADQELLVQLAEPLKAAVRWITDYGDRDGDGLIEYQRRSPVGLENQGWKDSADSVLDEQGEPLAGPIALVEVQGYAHYALRAAHTMFSRLGLPAEAEHALAAADRLKTRFLQTFFCGRQIAYALDGAKRPVVVATSNLGHLLFTDLLAEAAATQLARRLFHPDLASGFGIRTLSEQAAYYNPMSYHNGTVWPHDNALVAWGLKSRGQLDLLVSLCRQLYEASQYFPAGRLPELYCGFTRRAGGGPVHYPVACNPQAWSAAVPFFLLRLLLGIVVSHGEVRIRQPLLPPWVNYVYLERLRIAGGLLDIEFSRGRGGTFANVVRKQGSFRVLIEPHTAS